jgi:hypothetical protein
MGKNLSLSQIVKSLNEQNSSSIPNFSVIEKDNDGNEGLINIDGHVYELTAKGFHIKVLEITRDENGIMIRYKKPFIAGGKEGISPIRMDSIQQIKNKLGQPKIELIPKNPDNPVIVLKKME